MKTLYVMVGIPASGKSTASANLVKNGAVIVSSDEIRKEEFGDEAAQYTEEWLREQGYDGPDEEIPKKAFTNEIIFDKVHEKMIEHLKSGGDVISDSTNISKWVRGKLINTVGIYADEIVAIVVATPLKTCLERNSKRDRHVPEEVIERMANEFKFPSEDEGFDRIEYFTDKSDMDYGKD